LQQSTKSQYNLFQFQHDNSQCFKIIPVAKTHVFKKAKSQREKMRPLCHVDNHQKAANIPNAKLQIDHVADSRDIVMMSMDVQKEETMGS
jgi:hypothetical protein